MKDWFLNTWIHIIKLEIEEHRVIAKYASFLKVCNEVMSPIQNA